jgi:hypothetical protein
MFLGAAQGNNESVSCLQFYVRLGLESPLDESIILNVRNHGVSQVVSKTFPIAAHFDPI